ncbi:hypothetical protein [Streptomyces sp. NPDC037389]|uniref:hypothetical protein n=1 Tax=Streptomyces sp. NPDC037389 TaxID=3155369 RepID=UPI00340D3900
MTWVSLEDVTARLGRPLAEDERPRVQAFLNDVTALVQGYCGSRYREGSPAIRAVICGEVIRWLAVQPGIVAEKVGDMEVQWGTAGTQTLSAAAQGGLRPFRRRFGSIGLYRV